MITNSVNSQKWFVFLSAFPFFLCLFNFTALRPARQHLEITPFEDSIDNHAKNIDGKSMID